MWCFNSTIAVALKNRIQIQKGMQMKEEAGLYLEALFLIQKVF